MFSFLARSFPSLIKPYQPQSQQRETEKGADRELEAREEDRRQCTEEEVMEAAVPSLCDLEAQSSPWPPATPVNWIKTRQQPKGTVLNNAQAHWVH